MSASLIMKLYRIGDRFLPISQFATLQSCYGKGKED